MIVEGERERWQKEEEQWNAVQSHGGAYNTGA